MVGALIGLKFAILRHSTPAMRTTGRVAGLAAVAAAWVAAVAAGSDAARSQLLMLAAAAAAVGWLVGPTLSSGTGVLRPELFALLPLRRRRLGLALLAVSFAGVGPVVSVAALAALAVHAVALAPATVPVAAAGVVLQLAFVVTLSRLFFALLGAAMQSRLGVELAAVQYGALVASMLAGWMAVQVVAGTVPGLVSDGLPAGGTATGLAALPTSWPVRAVESAAAGQWPAAAGWLAALAALTAVLVALAARVLVPPDGGRPRSRRRRRRLPLAAGGRGPGGPLAAVVGKELRLWWRDPWRSLEVRTMIWAGLLFGLLALASGNQWAAPYAGLLVAFGAALGACNLYGQDGTALWLTVVGAGAGTPRADVRGRQLAVLLLLALPAGLLTVLFTGLSGQPAAWPVVLALLPAVLGAGCGLGLLLSVVAANPGVDPQHRVGPNDAGDVTFQVWVALLATPVLVAPTAAVAAAATAGSAGPGTWLALPVGIGNGLGVAWWLGRVAHRRLAARLPETFTRLRYGRAASAAAGAVADGGGWLDRLERDAVGTNQQRKPVGS